MRRFEFNLPGITCAACVTTVEGALASCNDVTITNYSIDLLERSAVVYTDDSTFSDEKIKSLVSSSIEDAGIECSATQPTSILAHTLKGILGTVCGLGLLGLSLAGVSFSFPAMVVITTLTSLLTLYLGKETYFKVFKQIRNWTAPTMDTLFTVSSLVALGISIAGFFVPGLPMMLDAALLIFGFRHIGKAIEESAKEKIITQSRFRSRAPKKVSKMEEGQAMEIATNQLKPQDVIRLQPGDIIPVDGKCLSKEAYVYHTISYGMTNAKKITYDQVVYAGTKVGGRQPIDVLVTASEEKSFLASLDAQIKKAREEKAPLETVAKKILKYFVPSVILFAVASALIVSLYFSATIAALCFAAVLVSACPCTFGIVVELGVMLGITKAAEQGVRFKSGKSLQAANQIQTVVFDWHGTLTQGEPRVIQMHMPESEPPFIMKLESQSDHSVATAIKTYLKIQDKDVAEIKICDVEKNQGVQATIDGEAMVIGNRQLMAWLEIDTSCFSTELKDHAHQDVIFFARNKIVRGYFVVQDTLRDDAVAVLKELNRMGKDVHVLSGGDASYIQARLALLNINFVKVAGGKRTDLKPAYIAELQKTQQVAMVGDAGNDALAMATSNFGLAVLQSPVSDEVTQSQAGAVIGSASLWPVITAFAVSNQTVANIRQNLTISIAYNLLALLLFGGLLLICGLPPIDPAIGAAVMVLQTVGILMNAQRFKHQDLPKAPAEKSSTWQSTDNRLQNIPTVRSRLSNANQLSWGSSVRRDNVRRTSQLFFTSPLVGEVGAERRERGILYGSRVLSRKRSHSCS